MAVRGGPWFFKASSAPPTRPLAGGAAQRCAEKRERGRGWGGGGTMEICGWSGGRGETEREREILHSLLLQQQLQLHLIRRHQRYFCNRSHSARVCASFPDLFRWLQSRKRRREAGGVAAPEEEEGGRGQSWMAAGSCPPCRQRGQPGERRGRLHTRSGPAAAALHTRNSRPGRPGAAPRPAPPRAAPTLFLKPLRALF